MRVALDWCLWQEDALQIKVSSPSRLGMEFPDSFCSSFSKAWKFSSNMRATICMEQWNPWLVMDSTWRCLDSMATASRCIWMSYLLTSDMTSWLCWRTMHQLIQLRNSLSQTTWFFCLSQHTVLNSILLSVYGNTSSPGLSSRRRGTDFALIKTLEALKQEVANILKEECTHSVVASITGYSYIVDAVVALMHT